MKPYYETGLGRLYHGSCLDIMPELEQVDLTVTSPPYDNLRTYNGYDFNFEGIAKELYRITKDGGVVVWIVADATINGSETGTSFKQALYFKEIGFNLHDTMIYKRRAAPLTHKRYEQGFEYMFIFCKGNISTFNGIQTPRKWTDNRKIKHIRREKDGSADLGYSGQSEYVLRDNVWKIFAGGGSSDKIASKHPAIFPEALAQDHILSWSNPNDIVLDPMVGSGTVAKMCERLNRRWLACETSEEYCKIAKQRIKQELSQKKLPGF